MREHRSPHIRCSCGSLSVLKSRLLLSPHHADDAFALPPVLTSNKASSACSHSPGRAHRSTYHITPASPLRMRMGPALQVRYFLACYPPLTHAHNPSIASAIRRRLSRADRLDVSHITRPAECPAPAPSLDGVSVGGLSGTGPPFAQVDALRRLLLSM